MPGAVGRTSTYALWNVTLPWVLRIRTSEDIQRTRNRDAAHRHRHNIMDGEIVNKAVADSFGMKFHQRWSAQ